MFTRDLSANVPLYGQEQCIWCGAASGQMSRNGYPNPADRLFYLQSDVWNAIQVRNSTAPADSGWATDPHGLTATLQDLANPPGVHWVEFANTNRDTVLFDILFWMNVRQYPSPVLVNQGGHWVVIVGWVTDVEPVGGSSPTLQSITVNDPEPHNVGTVTTYTGAQWFGGPWNGSIIYSGTWFNQYVAVVEPPIKRGKVRVTEVPRTGTKLLSAAQALASARRAVAAIDRDNQRLRAFFAKRGVKAFEPQLVREETPGRRGRKSVPHYYIVPFGFEEESGQRGTHLARASVLVNAYTGDLEEITTFGSPIRYLPAEDALDVVARALRVSREKLQSAQATLMFAPGDITHIRSYPFWRVQIGRRTIYVDQLGKLYGKFLPAIPGD
jgi:hypothetical protein